ncbi:DUF6790 family protein [Paramicrobacterium chengjingii]|uniref:DUF6790 family protein n=1 Tax=Paramicrobacterium chengjingii TaxID=2769067 RepID=UPI001420EDDA|nr:DUF6790 family protein [Microbacterium chengjingii]
MQETFTLVGTLVTPLLFPIIAVVVALVQIKKKSFDSLKDRLNAWLRSWFMFAVGFGALWIALAFVIAPKYFAGNIGFTPSPFQFEVAMANLGFAVVGFCCVRITDRAREVGMIGYLIFLFGAAVGHIIQFFVAHNDNPANIGTIVLVDIGVPVVALLLLRARRRLEPSVNQTDLVASR